VGATTLSRWAEDSSRCDAVVKRTTFRLRRHSAYTACAFGCECALRREERLAWEMLDSWCEGTDQQFTDANPNRLQAACEAACGTGMMYRARGVDLNVDLR